MPRVKQPNRPILIEAGKLKLLHIKKWWKWMTKLNFNREIKLNHFLNYLPTVILVRKWVEYRFDSSPASTRKVRNSNWWGEAIRLEADTRQAQWFHQGKPNQSICRCRLWSVVCLSLSDTGRCTTYTRNTYSIEKHYSNHTKYTNTNTPTGPSNTNWVYI